MYERIQALNMRLQDLLSLVDVVIGSHNLGDGSWPKRLEHSWRWEFNAILDIVSQHDLVRLQLGFRLLLGDRGL